MRATVLIASLMAILLQSGVVIVETIQVHHINKQAQVLLTPHKRRASAGVTLVSRCSPYYESDSKQWAECMGVAYR